MTAYCIHNFRSSHSYFITLNEESSPGSLWVTPEDFPDSQHPPRTVDTWLSQVCDSHSHFTARHFWVRAPLGPSSSQAHTYTVFFRMDPNDWGNRIAPVNLARLFPSWENLLPSDFLIFQILSPRSTLKTYSKVQEQPSTKTTLYPKSKDH